MSTEKPYYLGHRARLKERLLHDATQLADYEILELLLGYVLVRKDTKPLAKALLERFKSLRGVLDAFPEELLEVPGFGPGMISLWSLLREFMARYAESEALQRVRLQKAEDVITMARVRLVACQHEEIWAAFVSTSNQLLAWKRVGTGTVNASVLHIRDLLEMALKYKATGIILVHNHPGGTAQLSGADLQLTKQLERSAAELGIRLLDHIIIAAEQCFSYKENRLL